MAAPAKPQRSYWVNPNPSRGMDREDLELAEILLPYGGEERSIASQLEQAKALRDTGVPQGLNPTGRVFTKASPLEFAGAMAKRWAGGKSEKEGYEKYTEMSKKIAAEFRKKLEERDRAAALKKQQDEQAQLGSGESASAESTLPAGFGSEGFAGGFPMPPPSEPFDMAGGGIADEMFAGFAAGGGF